MAEPNAVDMSRWGGPLTPEQAALLIAQGVELIIVGTGWAGPGGGGEFARQQAETFLAAGGMVDAYQYLELADAVVDVRNGFNTLAGLPIRRWWADVEDTAAGYDVAANEQAIAIALQVYLDLGAQPAQLGIYTGGWWWRGHMGSSTRFAYLPLWNSYFDGNPDESGLPYGGWTHSAIEQYEGTTTLAGHSVDLDFAKYLETPGVMLTAEEINAAEQKRMRLRRIAHRIGLVAEDPDLANVDELLGELTQAAEGNARFVSVQ